MKNVAGLTCLLSLSTLLFFVLSKNASSLLSHVTFGCSTLSGHWKEKSASQIAVLIIPPSYLFALLIIVFAIYETC